jgi:adenosylcobinamide-phosphate synthase
MVIPQVATERATTVALALVADRVLGEPPARLHPVAVYGRAMEALEERIYSDDRHRGALYTAIGIAAAVTPAALLGRARSAARLPALAAATYLAVAGKALNDAASDVARPLRAGDLDGARVALPALVGRDPEGLGERELSRAAVESVAENTVDAVVAPVLWAAVGGPAGVLAYRAVNTLDAMVGHRSARYERFGWASARSDDIAAWIPARVTAVLVAAVRPHRARGVFRAVRRQAPQHPSPNAGVAEAAFAAALGLRLGGTNSYGGRVERRPDLGHGRRPRPGDIDRARALSRDVAVALAASLVGIRALGRRPRRSR